MNSLNFPPTRGDALSRLSQFVPHAGSAYASGRNTDPGPEARGAVSKLSPYVRHRLISEQEIVAAVLSQQSLQSAEKYVQEVLWRTYWKGWLEMRPSVWTRFIEERDRQREMFPNARAIASAEAGLTGIEGFDDWARELVAIGYLHNHARMWFASIWIFTLRLPWALGADFFMRHLIDADAASNTLSWRWVAGLQTVGKTYLATTENITRYTNGRFAPKGLAHEAFVIHEAPLPAVQPLPELPPCDTKNPALLLVTSDDLSPESWLTADRPIVSTVIAADNDSKPESPAIKFLAGAIADTEARASAHFGFPARQLDAISADGLIGAARAANVSQIITAYAPTGPIADQLTYLTRILAQEGIAVHQVRRDWDSRFWPYAKKGFFPFKETIPDVLRNMGIL